VKVWGTLTGSGVVLAVEIMALTPGNGTGETWVVFTGKVEAVKASSLDVVAHPNTGTYPVLTIAGRTVRTTAETKVKLSDGTLISASQIAVGQTATVEGWKTSDGSVRAAKVVVEGTGSGTGGTWLTFKGRVETLVALDTAPDFQQACVLKMTVAGRKVETDGSTVYKWSDGTALDPYAIVTGDQAYVEGWKKPEGYVLATKVVVDKR
jgi:hypothetical protein